MTFMIKLVTSLALLAGAGLPALAQGSDQTPFTLTAESMNTGGMLPAAQVNDGHGCKGGNSPPSLQWSAAPAGTKSFAVTFFDATAKHGAGFWHWAVFDIPPTARTLTMGETPAGAKVGTNDFGGNDYGGACPPAGDPAHHYSFTVWALKDATLPFDGSAPDAKIGAYLKANAIGKADLMFMYKR